MSQSSHFAVIGILTRDSADERAPLVMKVEALNEERAVQKEHHAEKKWKKKIRSSLAKQDKSEAVG